MKPFSNVRTSATIRSVGGSTAILGLGETRLITDPTLDPPGPSPEGMPRRINAPAVGREELGRLDAALVSHDQHPDNLDEAGRHLLADLPLVLTTKAGAERLGGTAVGLDPWEQHEIAGGHITITATPALHGPTGAEEACGPVIGFHIVGDGLPSVYVSGDNASLEIVREIAEQTGPVDIALLFAGAASVAGLMDGAPLTLTSVEAVEAARMLGARAVVPVHCDGWTHYSQGAASLEDAFSAAGLHDVFVPVSGGQEVQL